jgi:hypothetical protein
MLDDSEVSAAQASTRWVSKHQCPVHSRCDASMKKGSRDFRIDSEDEKHQKETLIKRKPLIEAED